MTLDGQSWSLPLRREHKAAVLPGDGAVLNRFGIFNMQDNNGKYCEVYLDDLTYSSRKVETAVTDDKEHFPQGLIRATTVRTSSSRPNQW